MAAVTSLLSADWENLLIDMLDCHRNFMVWQGLHLQVVHTHCICLEYTIHQLEISTFIYVYGWVYKNPLTAQQKHWTQKYL